MIKEFDIAYVTKFRIHVSKLSSILAEQRFYMEEDMNGRGREKSPLSFNIIYRCSAKFELNLVSN